MTSAKKPAPNKTAPGKSADKTAAESAPATAFDETLDNASSEHTKNANSKDKVAPDTEHSGPEKTPSGEIADDWTAAFSEQDSTDAADPWAAALNEQATKETASKTAETAPVQEQVFKTLQQDKGNTDNSSRELEMVMDIPVKLNVVLGRTRTTIKQLLELTEGSVVELDGLAGDPLDILINDYLVAQGEVVVVDDKYGIRISDIVTPSERIHRLNK